MDRIELKNKVNDLPARPGVYLMKDRKGEIIYVGKAVSLRNRVRSYFQTGGSHTPKVKVMVAQIDNLECIVTENELEALILECNLIKQYRPKYNISLKDDKSYPYLKVTLGEDYPRLLIVRSLKKDGSKYYGPFAEAGAVRETINVLKRVFPLKTCKKQLSSPQKERPCLNFHLGRCLAPCQGEVNKDEYRSMIEDICSFLDGRQDSLLKKLKEEMGEAANKLQFERAAELRNQIQALEKIGEKQRVISTALEDQDVIAFAREQDQFCIQVFFVRGGKLIGRRHFYLRDSGEEGEILSSFLKQFYDDAGFIPREILLPRSFDELRIIEQWLSNKKGTKVHLKVPKRGEKHKLLSMVEENAFLVLQEFLERQFRQEGKVNRALEELKQYLQLPVIPNRIECYDISNIQGSEPVGSMVVFEHGKPSKKGYRRFKIKTVRGPNDFAMLAEVVGRRFRRAGEKKDLETVEELKQKADFSFLPDLVIVDGGKGQLSAVREVMKSLGYAKIPTFGLAEQEEYLFREGSSNPIILPRNSEGLYLLQRIRDEAHRFAISYHRQLRSKRTFSSQLDEIKGIGRTRRRALLSSFGSVARIKQASLDELSSVKGMNRKIAEEVYNYFQRE